MILAKNMMMTSIGWLPCDWDVVAIKDVTNIVTGATPSTAVKEYWGGEIPWMSSGELNQKFVRSVYGRITQEGYNSCGTHMIPNHCVLIGLAGQGKTRGTAAYNTIPLCTNQSIASILPSASFDSLYLYYWIDSQYNYLRLLSAGDGGRGGLNKQLLLNLLVPKPSLAEQKRIADALFGIDQLIDSINEAITKKRQIKDGLMQQLLTGKTRLPGFSGEWTDYQLAQIGPMFAGGTPSTFNKEYWDGDICWLHSGAVQNCFVYPSNVQRTITSLGLRHSSARLIKADSVIVAITGATCANIGYLTFESAANQSVVAIEPTEEYDAKFLYYKLLKSREQILSHKGGSAQSGVSLRSLSSVRVYLPVEKKEQMAISDVLFTIDAEIQALESEHKKYNLIKQGMMQELLTGKTRLV